MYSPSNKHDSGQETAQTNQTHFGVSEVNLVGVVTGTLESIKMPETKPQGQNSQTIKYIISY